MSEHNRQLEALEGFQSHAGVVIRSIVKDNDSILLPVLPRKLMVLWCFNLNSKRINFRSFSDTFPIVLGQFSDSCRTLFRSVWDYFPTVLGLFSDI